MSRTPIADNLSNTGCVNHSGYVAVVGLERKLDTLTAELERVKAERDALLKTFPHCDKHKPNGGHRAGCVICSGEKLCAALSRIDYSCGEPNDEQMSGYDLHCDEETVVANVQKLRAERDKYLTGLRNNEGMAQCMDMLRQDLIAAKVIDASVAPMFMTDAVLKIAAERDALRVDAERYRWLRFADLDKLADDNWGTGEVWIGEQFDAAIDAARGRE